MEYLVRPLKQLFNVFKVPQGEDVKNIKDKSKLDKEIWEKTGCDRHSKGVKSRKSLEVFINEIKELTFWDKQ